MTVKELIRKLQCFDKEHYVEMEILTECRCLTVGSEIQDVQFKNGNCVLSGCDW